MFYTKDEGADDWFATLPISVNNAYGDPLIPAQIDDTIAKLRALKDHRAPFALFTKAGWNEAVAAKLRAYRLSEDYSPRLTVFYSLTDLGEGGVSFASRTKLLGELQRLFPPAVVLVRPIIRGRNDDAQTLRKIVGAAREAGGYLVLGGLHDPYKMKKILSRVEEELIDLCERAGVKSFYKTSCCAAYVQGEPCWMHALGAPRHAEALRALGYAFTRDTDGGLLLDSASTGDLNFCKLVTRSEVRCQSLVSNYDLLSFSTPQRLFECTSSWYCWAYNAKTCFGCDYCIIKQIEYLQEGGMEIGCRPADISAYAALPRDPLLFTRFRQTQLPAGPGAAPVVEYADVRAAKPCRCEKYRGLFDR